MPAPVHFKLNLPTVAGIMKEVGEAVDDVVRQSAFNIEGRAKINIVEMNAVDTGFMMNSIYTRTSKGSTFTQAKGAAQARADRPIDSAGAGGRPLGRAEIVVGAHYAVHVHDGARGRPARPFLMNAFVAEAPEFERGLRGLFKP